MNRQVIALRDDVDDRLDITEVDVGMNALSVQVKSEVHEIDVACAFSIAE